jgi:hypothetical protein
MTEMRGIKAEEILRQGLFFVGFLCLWLALGGQITGQVIRLEDGNFVTDGGEEFRPIVLNYDVQLRFERTKAGNEIYLSPAHSYFTGPTMGDRCKNPKQCASFLNAHFKDMADMGFNTVRIVGHYTYSLRDGADKPAMWSVGDHWEDRYFEDLVPPYTNNFRLIEEILDLADRHGLKVILLTGGHGVDRRDWRTGYAEYLAALAAHFAKDPRILAFDLINEPEYFHSSDEFRRAGEMLRVPYGKEDVAGISRLWTEAIRQNTNHLITMGLTGAGTVFGWDPNVLDLDFVSYHLYPKFGTKNYKPEFFNEVRWMGQSARIPWIIGETGFSASPFNRGKHIGYGSDRRFNPNDGTLKEQKQFALETAQWCLDCGGLGYAWWQYKDVHWENDYSVKDSLDGRKPVADAFRLMYEMKSDPERCRRPVEAEKAELSGPKMGKRVTDRKGNPVLAAVVTTDIKKGSRGRAYTAENGRFEVRGNGYIGYLRVSAPGYRSRIIYRPQLILKRKIRLDPVGCTTRKCLKSDCRTLAKTEFNPSIKAAKKAMKECKTTADPSACEKAHGAEIARAKQSKKDCKRSAKR